MKNLVLIIVLFISSVAFSQTNNNIKFKQGVQDYNNGDYLSAISLFTEIINNGEHSKQLYFNLGNTYYKLNDIPNTCASTVKALKDLNINYLTIHISSGLEALKAVKKISGKTKIVGVTTLTSLNNKNLREIGHKRKIENLVLHQAKLAKKAKLDALVCSAKEVKKIRKIFKKEIITPGIRLDNKINDQKRVMNPFNAFKAGSDWLVIGRSITKGNIKKNLKKLIDHLGK